MRPCVSVRSIVQLVTRELAFGDVSDTLERMIGYEIVTRFASDSEW
jgi:hypothetical protein